VVRLFVALRPPPEAIAHLRAWRPRWPGAPERWHVTLVFLGEAQPGPVAVQLRDRLQRAEAFELWLQGSGSFGRGGPVWVGVDGDLDALHDLHEQVATAARAAGISLERKRFRPHLTVGRRGQPDPRTLASYTGPAWTACEVELVRSDLGREVRHSVLERYPLTARSTSA
jgi:2'-5' RNA ligase